MSVRSIIGVYEYVQDNKMSNPKVPTNYQGMNQNDYDKWVKTYQPEFHPALNELKDKITHVSYDRFKNALEGTVKQFQSDTTKLDNFKCVSFVQPGKSQKWVTEVAMTKGFKANAYVCLGEEGANNLEFSLKNISFKDQRFKNVVIIDDGSFSGNQMANNISAAHRILESKFNEASNFYILIPFITKTAREKINKLSEKGISLKLYTYEEMPLVNKLVSPNNVSKLLQTLWPNINKEERMKKGNSTSCYWFDHKIPNSMSFPGVLATGEVTQPKEIGRDTPIAFLPNVQPPYK